MKKIITLLISLTLIVNVSLWADEGMWLLPLLKQLNIKTMNEMGLQLTAEDIYSINQSSLKDAIVIFGGGCTAEMISDEGLLITNHHCGYGAIQSHSDIEHNYLKDGFWAMSRDEELPNERLSVTFLIRIEDVSEKINAELNYQMAEDERSSKIREIAEEIQNEATEDTHYSARVTPFFGGNNFYLFVYETYRDVRLVGAPPSSIGKFGADTDNWMWPRHTGDFSIFRVYCDPDGKPAPYSKDNIPYKPKHYLPISLKGVEKGDFAMILGYPGGTQRYITSYGVNEVLEIIHPNRIKIRGIRQELMLKDMLASEKVRIQYSSKYSGSTNYWKFSIGQSKSLKRLKIIKKKQEIENKFRDWVASDKQRMEKYSEALNYIEETIKNRRDYEYTLQYINEALVRGIEIISLIRNFYELYGLLVYFPDSTEKINQEAEYNKKVIKSFFKNYNAPTDKKIAVAMLKLFYEDVDKQFQPTIFQEIQKKYKGNFNNFVDKMYSKSIFVDQYIMEAFLEKPNKNILEKDLAFKTFQSIFEKLREIRTMNSVYEVSLNKGRRLFIAGILEMENDSSFYPDANFTMRLTFGTVGDYNPMDAVYYRHYTTLKGVMEKEDPDNWEFVVPLKLKELYENKDYGRYGKDGYLPVCFTTNNDITGGNSGSPVINGNGELLGLAFDGNWESMSGDITFEPELQKCISVDIRFVLFIIDKYAGAKHLINEMTIIE